MSAVEDRMELRPLEELLASRAGLIALIAPLRARHANFGVYGDLRKIELAKVAAMIRAKAVSAQMKISEAAIDEAAHASEHYCQFVTTATLEKARWVELEDQVQAINDIILRENAIARFLAAEARL